MNLSSNLKLSSILLVLMAALSACTQPDKGESSGSDFYVTKLTARAQVTTKSNVSGWAVPKVANYTLTACVTDRATSSDIRGHRFQVMTEDKSSLEVLSSTDSNGCFTWAETFAFEYFAKNTPYVTIERDIVGTGLYKGSRKVVFAINPWTIGEQARQKGDAMVLLNDGSKTVNKIPEEQLASAQDANQVLGGLTSNQPMSKSMQNQSRIWVDSVSLKTVKRRSLTNGYSLDVLLNVKPLLKLFDSDGNPLNKTMNSGTFDVVAHLVVTDTGKDENEKLILTDVGGSQASGKVDLGQLRVMLRTNMIQRAHNGNVTLALKLIPKGIANVAPFEGLFELGGLQTLGGNPSASLLPSCNHPTEQRDGGTNVSDSPCQSVDQFIKGASNFEKLKKEGFASDNETFLYDLLKLRFISVLAGETATQRTVLYSVNTCITDRYDGSKVANIPFKIEYLDENGAQRSEILQPDPTDMDQDPNTLTKQTDAFGCLKWNAKIAHHYYKPEQFFWQKVRITREIGGKGKNVEKIMDFALNPWDDKFTFGWDKLEFVQFASKKAKSRFFMSSFGYHTVRFLYNIDPFMELEVKKTVLLDLQPRVLRYSGIIDARKRTEQVRDGIYLLKVAIQKDFLDPTERNVDIKVGKRKSESLNNAEVPSVIMDSLGPVEPREYITTDTSLVRVVDGHLIHPIELTMRDLRLMRVRSNFLIQLETVDERLIQNHDVLNKLMRNDLEALRVHRGASESVRSGHAPVEGTDADTQVRNDKEEVERIRNDAKAIKEKYRAAFYDLKQQLETMPFGSYNGYTNVDPAILKPILSVLQINDFTDVNLAGKDQANLNEFIEKDSGLEVRSFVGPVIFLSNAYSDSVRATDNMDEAKCSDIEKLGQKRFIDGDDKDLYKFGFDESLLANTASSDGEIKDVENDGANQDISSRGTVRLNKAYRFSRYYGALTHLCPKVEKDDKGHDVLKLNVVDRLIEKERAFERHYNDVMPWASSKANFVRSNGVDYLSLVDEPLEDLPADECDKEADCSILRSRKLSRSQVARLMGPSAIPRQNNMGGNTLRGEVTAANLGQFLMPKTSIVDEVDEDKIHTLVSPSFVNDETDVFASCSLLSELLVDRLQLISSEPKLAKYFPDLNTQYLRNPRRGPGAIYDHCIRRQRRLADALQTEEKLKVYQTGVDYVFRGGLQMNFNVGRGTSFSRSDSWSGGFGFEDVPNAIRAILPAAGMAIGSVGGPLGAVAGLGAGTAAAGVVEFATKLIKPLSLKISKSDGSSEGTNVTAGTYLVSQVAKFDVPVSSYERCRIIRFGKEFSVALGELLGVPENLSEVVRKGVMICGQKVTSSDGSALIKVPETYFYFTQHFTEGDMLDQADLYNHPWLLSMRGLRDFGTFVREINAQEVPSLAGFWSGLNGAESSPAAWPLDHLANTYRNLTPSFPGFYTFASKDEMITNYPLRGRLTQFETDINGEVKCTMEKSNSSLPTCVEKLAK